MARFELATPRPPDVYSNRAEPHPYQAYTNRNQCAIGGDKTETSLRTALRLLNAAAKLQSFLDFQKKTFNFYQSFLDLLFFEHFFYAL